MRETLGIAGSGAIACGLAATAAHHGEVLLLARSDASADRARRTVERICGRMGDEHDPSLVRVVTDVAALGGVSMAVEAVVEDHDMKVAVLKDVVATVGADTLVATTTSSLSVGRLGEEVGISERFVGLHVFNPVPKMKLVELAFPDAATAQTRQRAHDLCEALGKAPVHVPDTAGFVVNRLLFPYLFSAVEFLVESDMTPADVDRCMVMGAGHPMGPLALLDYVGLDVSKAIGECIGAPIPARIDELIADGALGKKAGRGFYDYETE